MSDVTHPARIPLNLICGFLFLAVVVCPLEAAEDCPVIPHEGDWTLKAWKMIGLGGGSANAKITVKECGEEITAVVDGVGTVVFAQIPALQGEPVEYQARKMPPQFDPGVAWMLTVKSFQVMTSQTIGVGTILSQRQEWRLKANQKTMTETLNIVTIPKMLDKGDVSRFVPDDLLKGLSPNARTASHFEFPYCLDRC